jgi:NAD-dependent deacetylase
MLRLVLCRASAATTTLVLAGIGGCSASSCSRASDVTANFAVDSTSDAAASKSTVDSEALSAAARQILSARRVVAFTGAGISAESGISTYRAYASGGDGLWDGLRGALGLLLFGTRLGFLFLPATAWRLYCERLLLPISQASPNAGHVALAAMADAVITQNVDGLHQEAGSSNTSVIELHGSVRSHRHTWTGEPIEVGIVDPRRPPARFTRPDVVLFFEPMPAAFWTAASLIAELGPQDVLLCVGTSGMVAPANSLPYAAMSNGCHVIEVNLERCLADEAPITPYTEGGEGTRPVMSLGKVSEFGALQTLLVGNAAEVLPALARRVQELKRSEAEPPRQVALA